MEKLHYHYKLQGVKVGGFITREVNENGKRVGFRITDLRSDKEGWLAKAQPGSGPMYGRYCIILADLEDMALGAPRTPVESNRDIGLIDEIGPMEKWSMLFTAAIS